MMLRREPSSDLAPFVKTMWLSDETRAPARTSRGALRELALPTGHTHLALRLSDDPLRVFDGVDDAVGRVLSHAVVGGARATHYVRDVSTPTHSVGAMLFPGATLALFGVPEGALAERHTQLEELVGRSVVETMRARLRESPTPHACLERFEQMLRARLRRARTVHPAVAQALEALGANAPVADVVAESGYSHRRFIELFQSAVGLTPKVYARVKRFEGALALRARRPDLGWASLATSLGYADQAHFTREFRAFAGVTPTYYGRAAPVFAHHVPLVQRGAEVNSVQERTAGERYRSRRSPR